MASCPTCGVEYSNKRGLVRYHFYDNPEHAPDFWEQCPSCDKVFEKSKNIRIHHEKEHGESIAHSEICESCGDEFYTRPSHQEKYCSVECFATSREKWDTSGCEECGKKFDHKPSQDREYCSRQCVGKSRQNKITVECAECSEPVTKKRQRIERVNTVYCDEDCWRSAIESDEFRDSNDEKKFRNAVFERDNYTCQDCGEYGGTLNAHHIERVSENKNRATDIDNGVTLCVNCHANRHEESGEHKSARLIRSKYK